MAPDTLLIGRGARPALLRLDRANRHGLVAGATGTGKTVTLQVLAEGFSDAGVPVFCADIKGDLAGLGQPGRPNPKFEARARELGVEAYDWRPCPAVYWDVFGAQGHPMRATAAELGPLLLARMLELNDTQEGVLAVAFAVADDQGLLLLDLKDLRAILAHLAENAAEIGRHYGNVGKATVATIQRRLLVLEQAGAGAFLGEPALDLSDLMLVSPEGRGAVNVLAADVLVRTPRLYAAFLLWLLSELFEALPEAGDLDRPKLVFFFDEAHLLFADAPRALVEKVEQVVRLIRSKGVGVYFVTQNPLDLPPAVLGQLGNRVQHALRAFTPSEQKAVRAAAATFRPDPALDVERAIGELAVGEALVSTLQADGTPSMVDRVRIVPPRSRMGAVTPDERAATVARSPLAGRYDAAVDRESAYELLSGRAGARPAEAGPHRPAGVRDDDPWGSAAGGPAPGGWGAPSTVAPEPARRRVGRSSPPPPPEGGGLGGLLSGLLAGDGRREGAGQALAKSAARSLGTKMGGQLGQAVVRGLLGSILRR